MSQEIEVRFEQKGDVYTVHTGSPVLGDIVMDYTGYPEDARGGNSSILLISAALSCFCGSVRAALVARGVPFRSLQAVGKGVKTMNEQGSMRLSSLPKMAVLRLPLRQSRPCPAYRPAAFAVVPRPF